MFIPEIYSLSIIASDVASKGIKSFNPGNARHNGAVLQLFVAQRATCSTTTRCFGNAQQLQPLADGLLAGFHAQQSTRRCCLHAFQLRTPIVVDVSRVMEKLSQITSNPAIAMHNPGLVSHRRLAARATR